MQLRAYTKLWDSIHLNLCSGWWKTVLFLWNLSQNNKDEWYFFARVARDGLEYLRNFKPKGKLFVVVRSYSKTTSQLNQKKMLILSQTNDVRLGGGGGGRSLFVWKKKSAFQMTIWLDRGLGNPDRNVIAQTICSSVVNAWICLMNDDNRKQSNTQIMGSTSDQKASDKRLDFSCARRARATHPPTVS